jgi:hypothetical protein
MKNRRYRNAKISEHRLSRVVRCFAVGKSAKDTATITRLSEPSVEALFMKLREKLLTNGGFLFPDPPPVDELPAAAAIYNKTYRGVPGDHTRLFEAETIYRIVMSRNYRRVLRLDAAKAADRAKAERLYLSDPSGKRYRFFELLSPGAGEADPKNTRAYVPGNTRPTSVILVNELQREPGQAFFQFIWQLLLKSPL